MMKKRKYDIVLFDLDGTITDTGEGIMKSIKYALECIGIKEENEENLRRFIGPSLWDSFNLFYGLDAEATKIAVEKYRERYSEKGVYQAYVYQGIEPLLNKLKSSGIKTAISSTKPTFFVDKVISSFKLGKYFDAVVGSELSGERSDKAELIPYTLNLLHAGETERVVMIGDRKFDGQGANICGVDFIGVSYGYGSIEELERENPAAICNDAIELENALFE